MKNITPKVETPEFPPEYIGETDTEETNKKGNQMKTTRKQREAILTLWRRDNENPDLKPSDRQSEYREFRKRFISYFYDDCLMINLWGMWIGIEKDGYTHS